MKDNFPELSSKDDVSNRANTVKSLTIKDYLETATDASKRTRFITIILVVVSVLVLVSVLNSPDSGWITLRINALRHKTSKYTIRKFPLLCRCEPLVKEVQPELCEDVEDVKKSSINNDIIEPVRRIDNELESLEPEILKVKGLPQETELKKKHEELLKKKKEYCAEETRKLETFTEAMQRSAADTKFTVRVPFFGVAFDVNDVGILGGFSLWIVLLLLRLSLRNQIVSLRVGFKEAFECGQEKDFYQILAARQVFVFPPLRDAKQKVTVSQGWIEQWWRHSTLSDTYRKWRSKLLVLSNKIRGRVLSTLKIEEKPKESISTELSDSKDQWQANRNIGLRIVPKALSLLPLFIYSFQFFHDLYTLGYGKELSLIRTWQLVVLGSFFLVNIAIFGVWCITKWNELDRLWDYYDEHLINRSKLGETKSDQESVEEK